jgi:hypothetical protein
MANSSDYGKEMRATLDWNDPDLLREMLRLRLLTNLEAGSTGDSFEDLWAQISVSHVFGEESADFIIQRSLMRPRNVLKLFNHIRGFAVNFARSEMTIDDYYKGLRAYSQDLLVELDRELTDVFPQSKDLLYYFMDCNEDLSKDELAAVFSEAAIPLPEHDRVREFLLYYGVLGLRIGGQETYIFDHGYNIKALTIRADRAGAAARFVVNPAFAPALEIRANVFERQYNLTLQ